MTPRGFRTTHHTGTSATAPRPPRRNHSLEPWTTIPWASTFASPSQEGSPMRGWPAPLRSSGRIRRARRQHFPSSSPSSTHLSRPEIDWPRRRSSCSQIHWMHCGPAPYPCLPRSASQLQGFRPGSCNGRDGAPSPASASAGSAPTLRSVPPSIAWHVAARRRSFRAQSSLASRPLMRSHRRCRALQYRLASSSQVTWPPSPLPCRHQ
mmetsp:Transcript_11125/g.26760  ORF Transcript_11125/g.26760 Transcript_11125/m.26760 type:complete len:208 (+) Transcript_11125:3-626(+)